MKTAAEETFWEIMKPYTNLCDTAISTNILANLNMSQSEKLSSFSESTADTIVNTIEKWKNHPIIVTTKNIYMVTVIWSQNRTKNESAKEKLCLDCIEATQETDILTEVVKENAALFTNFHSLIVKEVIQT